MGIYQCSSGYLLVLILFIFFLNRVIEDLIFSLQGFSDTYRNTGASGASMCSSGIIHNGITIFESSLG